MFHIFRTHFPENISGGLLLELINHSLHRGNYECDGENIQAQKSVLKGSERWLKMQTPKNIPSYLIVIL